MKISHLICTAYQVTGFYMKLTLEWNGLIALKAFLRHCQMVSKMGADGLGTQQVLRTQLCYTGFGDIPPN